MRLQYTQQAPRLRKRSGRPAANHTSPLGALGWARRGPAGSVSATVLESDTPLSIPNQLFGGPQLNADGLLSGTRARGFVHTSRMLRARD